MSQLKKNKQKKIHCQLFPSLCTFRVHDIYPRIGYKYGRCRKKCSSLYSAYSLRPKAKVIISLIPLLPRENDYDVLGKINKDLKLVNKLSESATNVWNSIKEMNIKEFGKAFKESFEAQVSIFPNMIDNNIIKQIKKIIWLGK